MGKPRKKCDNLATIKIRLVRTLSCVFLTSLFKAFQILGRRRKEKQQGGEVGGTSRLLWGLWNGSNIR